MEERVGENREEIREEPATNLAPVVDGREYCPRCGCPLQPFKCKLVCRCGYFMSCSDF